MTPIINSDIVDVVILGAGTVGSLLANALQSCPISIALIDAKPKADLSPAAQDQRAIALSRTSLNVLNTLGIFPELKTTGVPIHQVHICQQGGLGQVWVDREDEHVASLGHVVNIMQLQSILDKGLSTQTKCYDGYRVIEVDQQADYCELTAESTKGVQKVRAKLVIAADGAQSTLRTLLSLEVAEKDYQQTGIVCTVTTKRPHQNTAYERFTSNGPIALLPIADNQFSLVWCVRSDQMADLLALSEAGFIRALQAAFGYRVGRLLAATPRQAFPLKSLIMPTRLKERVLFFGNAAHTIHPIGGQGLNLCLREIALFAEHMTQHFQQQGSDLNDMGFLNAYLEAVDQDCRQTATAVDNLVTVFSNDYLGWPFLRGFGLQVLQRNKSLKSHLTKRMMGYRFPSARLSRGLSLCRR